MEPLLPPSEKLIEFLSTYDLKVSELALALRAMVLAEAPTATEIVIKTYAVSISFSFTDKWTDGFCMVVTYAGHVNLGFHHGALLDDPKGLLEGSGKQMRHIKIRQPEDLKKPYLRSFIQAAIKLCKNENAKRAAAITGKSRVGKPKS